MYMYFKTLRLVTYVYVFINYVIKLLEIKILLIEKKADFDKIINWGKSMQASNNLENLPLLLLTLFYIISYYVYISINLFIY